MIALLKTPVFIINLERRSERFDICVNRIKTAGFTGPIQRWNAIDALDPDALQSGWAKIGSPPMNLRDYEFCETYKGQQGCFLSHILLLKHVIENNIPEFIVFEDDISFHPRWNELLDDYCSSTPWQDIDLVYLGAQIEVDTNIKIGSFPSFCTHALYMNILGAKKIYDLLIQMPGGVRTIDCCLIDYQWWMLRNPSLPRKFNWLVWNAMMYNTQESVMSKDWAKRNCGLVFQEESYGSDVRPRN